MSLIRPPHVIEPQWPERPALTCVEELRAALELALAAGPGEPLRVSDRSPPLCLQSEVIEYKRALAGAR